MKKNSLLFVFVILLASGISSCGKKSDTTPTIAPGITASINGTETAFNTPAAGFKASATQTVNGSSQTATAVGVIGESSAGAALELVIAAQTIKAGTTFKAISIDSEDPNITSGAAIVYLPSLTGTDGYISTADNNSSVTVTAVTDTNIQGTFTGMVYQVDDSGKITSAHKTITNGKFNVTLTNVDSLPSDTKAIARHKVLAGRKIFKINLGGLTSQGVK